MLTQKTNISRFCQVGDLVEATGKGEFNCDFVIIRSPFYGGGTIYQWIESNKLKKIGTL